MINKFNSFILLGCILCITLSCQRHEEKYHNITDKINALSKAYEGTSISSEAYIHVPTIEITEGAETFLIPERKGQITSYACTECHTQPLKEMQSSSSSKKAHWDIKINHANQNTMECITCHNSSDMDNLKSLTGKSIDFNRSYQLCSQCHSGQFKDWKGGAHGKSAGGWSSPRAALTCVNCHNPHKPHIAPRWPVRYNTQKIKERD